MDNIIKVYWFGYGGSSWMAERLRYLIEDELDMKLYTIHEHPNADIPWKRDTVYKHLKNADIIILPANYLRQPCKSNNRLTQAMSLEKPIICEPMPSYLPIVENYKNAIILKTGELSEWRDALTQLRDDGELREYLAKNAKIKSEEYSIKNISSKWINALIYTLNESYEDKVIDVIVPTRNNEEILEECLKSFKNSTLKEEIYLIDNGDGVEDLIKKLNLPYEIREV